MRVTDQMVFQAATQASSHARERLEAAVEQAATGARVMRPQDDPGAAGRIVGERAASQRFSAIAEGTRRAADELTAADGALQAYGEVLARARELAVQLASDGYSASERSAGGREVQGLLNQAIAALNTRVGSRYLFGGNRDATPPFDPQGNYAGDDGVRKIEIAPGVLQDVSVRADVAVKGAGGGVDALATLSALRDALLASDGAAVRATLPQLDQAIQQAASARAAVGAAMNLLDTAAEVNRAARDAAEARLSSLADVDAFEVATRLARAQQALQAALAAGARTMELNLLGVLR